MYFLPIINILMHAWLQHLPPNAPTVLWSAGEIDCQEGIGGPALEGYLLHQKNPNDNPNILGKDNSKDMDTEAWLTE